MSAYLPDVFLLASVTKDSRPLFELDPSALVMLGLVALAVLSPVLLLTLAIRLVERSKR
jgi:hypothetical protein